MNLAEAFTASARARLDKTAVFWGEDQFTYAELFTQSTAVANLLAKQFGVTRGARVGLWLKNCPAFVPALFGVLQSGAVVVPINNFLKPDELSFILQDGGIDVLISESSMAEAFSKVQASRPQLRMLDIEHILAMARGTSGDFDGLDSTPCPLTEQDLAVIIYTSGTTGHPKGAMLSHGNLLANVESCRQVLAAVDADRFVVLLPMFHSFMLTVGVLLPLLVGGSLVIIRSVHPPKAVLQEIIQHNATLLPAVPAFFRTLSHFAERGELPLRLCISGGAPLPHEILREFTERMSVPLLEGYGLSEASPVVSINPLRGPWKAGSIGVPVPDVEVSVQNDEGKMLAIGETGEICVRGPNVMQGYWNQPEESARAIRNGWLLTGDIGHGDEDGYFFITDRKKDMLLVNGINVYPREVEEIIYRYPGIKEAAVIGIPDERKGEQPIAFVSLNDGAVLDTKALQQFVREKLADYKVPRRITCLPALPRNATGKILKTALRELAKTRQNE